MSNGDAGRITTELVLKLFDTLKDSNSHLKSSVEKQTEAIVHLTGLLKEGVKPEDLKKILEDHHLQSGQHLDNIDTCTETIEDKSDKILNYINDLRKKVSTMILVVVIAFSLMATSSFFVSSYTEQIIEKKIEQKHTPSYMDKNLLEQIEQLKKRIQEMDDHELN